MTQLKFMCFQDANSTCLEWRLICVPFPNTYLKSKPSTWVFTCANTTCLKWRYFRVPFSDVFLNLKQTTCFHDEKQNPHVSKFVYRFLTYFLTWNQPRAFMTQKNTTCFKWRNFRVPFPDVFLYSKPSTWVFTCFYDTNTTCFKWRNFRVPFPDVFLLLPRRRRGRTSGDRSRRLGRLFLLLLLQFLFLLWIKHGHIVLWTLKQWLSIHKIKSIHACCSRRAWRWRLVATCSLKAAVTERRWNNYYMVILSLKGH